MRVLDGRRSVAALVSGVVCVGLACLGPGVAAPASADPSDELGYPATIRTDHDADDLPRTPGRMSGAFVGRGRPTSMESAMTGTTFLVSPAGRTYRLPQTQNVVGYVPPLSPDGSRLAYFPDPHAYVIRDLVTGETTRFDQIRYGDPGLAEQFAFEGNRALWSSDGTRLLISAAEDVVLSLDGTVTEVSRPRGRSHPVGWLGDEIAWLSWRGSDPDNPVSGRLVVAPVSGGPARTVRLEDVGALSEVVGAGVAVSPDGSSLAVVTTDGETRGRFTLYSTADGSVTARSTVDQMINPNCPLSWASGGPAVAGALRSDALLAMSGETIVRSRDEFAPCSVWAADALAGPRSSAGVLDASGSGTASVVGAGAGVIVIGGVVCGWVLVRRRRKRLAPTS